MLDDTFSTLPARLTTTVLSMFVNKTKAMHRAHFLDKKISFV